MRYCGPLGIPLSTFLAWDPLDQDAALAWQAHESRRCGSCGTHPDDWERDRQTAWHAEPDQCPGCVELQQLDDTFAEGERPKGLHLHLARGGAADCARCSPDD